MSDDRRMNAARKAELRACVAAASEAAEKARADDGMASQDYGYVTGLDDGMRLLAEALDALDAAERRAAEAEGLLSRAVKYAREDRMRTPGLTRLARVLAEAERSLALASVATGGQGGEGT